MKKVILFLLALSTIVGAQAQMMSSGGSSSFKSGAYNSSDSSLDFSGKISTIPTDSEVAADPSYTEKSKSIFSSIGSIFTKKDESTAVALKSNTKSQKTSSYAPRLNKIYFSWNFASESDDTFYDGTESKLSFTFGYSHATNLFKEWIYVDYGLAATATELYYYNSENDDSDRISNVEVRVPVNLMANIKLSQKIYFRPYVGFSLGGNVLNDTSSWMESDTEGFKFGYQFGAGLAMGKIYLGCERRRLEQIEDINFNATSLVLGVTF